MEITLKIEANELAQAISKLADAISSVKGSNASEVTGQIIENTLTETETPKNVPDEKPTRKKRSSNKAKKEDTEPVKETAEKAESTEPVKETAEKTEPTEQELRDGLRDRLKAATLEGKIKKETLKNTLADYGYAKLSDIPLDKLKAFEQEVMA